MKTIIGIPFDSLVVCRGCGDTWRADIVSDYKNEIVYLDSCGDCPQIIELSERKEEEEIRMEGNTLNYDT